MKKNGLNTKLKEEIIYIWKYKQTNIELDKLKKLNFLNCHLYPLI